MQLSASQQWSSGMPESTIEGVASMLLDALRLPMKLEWEASLDDPANRAQATVKMSVDIDSGAIAWPLAQFNLKVIPARAIDCEPNVLSKDGFPVKSSVSFPELVELLHASSGSAAETARHKADTPKNTDANDDTAKADEAIDKAQVSLDEIKPTSVPSLPLVDSDDARGIWQPACLKQWHGSVCGHHALFSIQCLLDGEEEKLQDGRCFWKRTLRNIQLLADHGEASGRWPASRVTGGVIDEVHLKHLIESSESLHGRVSIAQTSQSFEEQLNQPESAMRRALDDVVNGHSHAHAFLLGATTHWYAAVVFAEQSHPRTSREPEGISLFFCDTFNRPMARLKNDEDVERLIGETLQRVHQRFIEQLRGQPEWKHRPLEALDRAFEEGLPEWWKGNQKSSLFWCEPPREVRSALKKQELQNIRSYLGSLTHILGLSIAVV
jgi:hypothetical protein